MMEWTLKYERFNQTEKLLFKRLINQLLSKTFLIRDEYDAHEGRLKVHPDYRFVERTFEVFTGYLELSGWTLHRDSTYGVIYLESQYDYNKYQFSKFMTLMLLTLRLIYEERREEVSLRNEVVFETNQLISKMQILGILDKKPSMKDIADTLKTFASFNLVSKLEGKWEAPDARFVALPSILFIIPNDKISVLSDLIGASEEVDDSKIDTADVEIAFDQAGDEEENEMMEDLL